MDNVGNIWSVMVTALSQHSKTNIVTMLSLFHPTLAQYLTNTCIVSVLPDLYSCSRTKQRKEQLSQEKAATILESAMLVNTPKLLKTCLILHWTRWKVYFQKPTQLRWLRAKFNKNFQISFCKILKTNSTVWKLGRGVSFKWSHHWILSADAKIRITLRDSNMHSSSKRVKSIFTNMIVTHRGFEP